MFPKHHRDHIVPKFILKNFGPTLIVYDKEEKSKPFAANYESAPAWEKDFESVTVWHYLRVIDNQSSRAVIHLLRTKNPTSLSDKDRFWLNWFVGIQMVRTKRFRNILQKYMKRQNHEPLNLPEDKRAEVLMNEHARYVTDIGPKYTGLLSSMRFSLMVNQTSYLFWISDNPVAIYDQMFSSKDNPNAGLLLKGLQIYFPLTPRLQLAFLEPSSYNPPAVVLLKQKEAKGIWLANNLQYESANRFIFSSDGNFDFVNEILRDKEQRVELGISQK